MVRIFKSYENENRFQEIKEIERESWVMLTNPTMDELVHISEDYQIDLDDLKSALDPEERSRLENEENYTMILVNIPVVEEENEKSNYQSNIFEVVEKEFGRTLSPMEYEIIKAWLDNDMSEDLIKEAIKEATFNGVSNLRYIDKILYEWGKQGIKTVKDVEDNRHKRAQRREEEADSNIDLDIVDWDWFDDDSE